MTSQEQPPQPRYALNPRITYGALAVLAVVVLLTALQFYRSPNGAIHSDFDVFHIVGRLIWDGQLIDAYYADRFWQLQHEHWGTTTRFLWSYPPQFDLIAAALALVPSWLAYLIFIGGGLVAYLLVLRALSGPYFPIALAIVFPVLILTARTGQNGFLTGAFIGWFAWSYRRTTWQAGVPLGLMVLKPHLAIGIGVFALLSRRWGPIAVAAAVVVVTSLAATLAFGPGVWPAFRDGVRISAAYLEAGAFQEFRMVSLFTALRSLGLESGWAMIGQAVLALIALGVLIAAWFRGWAPPRLLGVAVLTSTLISPYNQDYDLTIYGIAVALLIDDVALHASRAEGLLLFALSWFLCGYGLATIYLMQPHSSPVSLAGLAAIAIFAVTLRVLGRAERAAKTCDGDRGPVDRPTLAD